MRHLTICALLVTGCMIPNNQKKLSDSLRQYNIAMRWGAVEQAAEHVDPAKRNELLVRPEEFGALQISGYEVGSIKVRGKSEAVAIVRIDWYLNNSLSLHTSFVEQSWKLKGGKWLITAQRLVRGAPYPLLIDSPERRSFRAKETWPEA